MKYKSVDWSSWPEPPSEQTFNDWVASRKIKKTATTQSSINYVAKHMRLLYQNGISADQTLEVVCARGWLSFKFNWVMNELADDIVACSPIRFSSGSLEDELNNTDWAN